MIIVSLTTFNVSAATVKDDYKVEKFEVVSLDTNTGEESTEIFDTSVTAKAMSAGKTIVSSPAYEGTVSIGVMPNSIIGTDGRYKISNPNVWPYRATCRIVSYFDENRDGIVDTAYSGTGFLEGPSAVVTAGHVIYNSSLKMWCKYAEVTFAQNGSSKPYGTIRSTTIHTSVAWMESGDTNQDWSVIEIASPIGNTVGWYGKLWTSASLNGTSVSVSGYSGDKTGTQANTLWRSVGSITASLSARLAHNCDTTGGVSGAAILNSSNQALAIHTSGNSTSNYGTRITEWLYNYLENFRP